MLLLLLLSFSVYSGWVDGEESVVCYSDISDVSGGSDGSGSDRSSALKSLLRRSKRGAVV